MDEIARFARLEQGVGIYRHGRWILTISMIRLLSSGS